jgi:hypothetical protein
MTGIYSQPIQYPTQPENAMRARAGERPMCFNRPDLPPLVEVQDGWQAVCLATPEGLTSTVFAPAYLPVVNGMSKDCRAWAVREPDRDRPGDTGEDPATDSIPGREGWRRLGCRHLPDDPRVAIRAAASELW